MKKKWSGIMAMLLSLVILITAAAPVLAQNEEDTTAAARPQLRNGLAVLAPLRAPVGKAVTMTVLARSTAEPVAGAGIWALTREEAEALREEMTAMRESTDTALAETDWESAVSVRGIFLGRTGDNGKLDYTFDEEGRYVLIAIKKGYVPGRTSIAINDLPRALAIRAPQRAPVGEEVTMTVLQRGTEEPVEGAGIWALTREEAEALREEMTAMRESTDTALAEADWESVVSVRGIFLGRTDPDGELDYAFDEEGRYLLVAVKRGYFPGHKGIAIGNVLKALIMDAPRRAKVGQEVTMTVLQRGTEEPVEGAGIWALTREEAEILKEEITAMRESGDNSLAEADWESVVSVRGIFLGRTDADGELDYAFGEEGGYILVAVKRGYFPGRISIAIRSLPEPQVERPQIVPGQTLRPQRVPGKGVSNALHPWQRLLSQPTSVNSTGEIY